MTRREFQLIAAALKRSRAPRCVVVALAQVLATRNPKFNADKFYLESGQRPPEGNQVAEWLSECDRRPIRGT